MKTPPHVLLFALVLVTGAMHAQVLTIEEISRDGERHPIDFTQTAYPIVDINSTLKVHMDKNAVRRIADQMKPSKPAVEPARLDAIATILNQEAGLLALLGPSTRSFADRRADLQRFSDGLLTILTFASQQKALSENVNTILGSDLTQEQQYAAVFQLIREETFQLTQEIKRSSAAQTVHFRLGAWLLEDDGGAIRPIHVPQFDNYKEGAFYQVPRFVLPSSEELRRSYAAAVEAAKNYNENGFRSLDGLKEHILSIRDSLQSALMCLRSIAADIQTRTDRLEVKNAVRPLVAHTDSLIGMAQQLEGLVRMIIASPEPLKAARGSLNGALQLFKSVESNIESFDVVLSTTIENLKRISAQVRELAQEAERSGTACLRSLTPLVKDIQEVASLIKQWQALGVAEQRDVNLQFGNEVNRFLIEDIPESTDIDLRYTGQRSPDDQIYVKAALEDSAVAAGQPAREKEIERRVFTMFQIDWHAQLSVGVVFVSPFQRVFAKQFQAAPSYSIVARHGSRTSYMYNRFWSVGFGLNATAPDFNLDGTPEVGLGGIVSTMKDYVQLGLGYNFGAAKAYWFFGVRFPIGAITIPNAAPPEK